MAIESGSILKDVYRVDHLVYADPALRVYWATHTRLGLEVDLTFEVRRDAIEASPRARRSIELMQRIRHPNVVPLLDHWVTPDGEAVYVTESVSGETLSHHMVRRGALPWHQVAFVMDGVLRALEAIHEAELVHRNVTPSAIMLSSMDSPVVRLSGMRLLKSKAADHNIRRITRRGEPIPTTPYSSPEVLLAREAGPASDLFSLSVVAYQLLSGHLPGRPGHPMTIVERVGHAPPQPQVPMGMPAIPPAFLALLMNALSVDPEERPESAASYRKYVTTFANERFPADQVPVATRRQGRNSYTRMRVRSSAAYPMEPDGHRGSVLVAALLPASRVLGDHAALRDVAGAGSVCFDLGIRFSLALLGGDADVDQQVAHIQKGLAETHNADVPVMAQLVDQEFYLPARFLNGEQAPPKEVLDLLDRLAAAYPDPENDAA